METTEKTKTRIITLTNARPVRVKDDAWPIIATGSGNSWDKHPGDGRYREALRQGECDTYTIRVRQHADGRVLVYGIFCAATFRVNPGNDHRGGYLLNDGGSHGVIAAIRRVGDECGIPDVVVRECIADLEPEDI